MRLLGTPERSLVDVVSRAIAHMEERRTVIPRGEIRAVALGHAPGRYRLEEIDAAIERLCREGELVETNIPRRRYRLCHRPRDPVGTPDARHDAGGPGKGPAAW